MLEWFNLFLSTVYKNRLLCAGLIALGYAALAALAWRAMGAQTEKGQAQSTGASEHYGLLLLVILHTGVMLDGVWASETANNAEGLVSLSLGFAQALSFASVIGLWIFLLESRWVNLYALRPLALCLPAVAVVLAASIRATPVLLTPWTALHVLCAIAAHGMALLCAGHALLIWRLDRSLRLGLETHSDTQSGSGALARIAQHSPPLVVLERSLLRLCVWVIGLLAATVGLGSFRADSGALRLDHKTVLTVVSLCAWAAVWWGYHQRAWRGRTLNTAVWGATGLLLLSYIGSRFVMQEVLHKI